jgi:GNAT superfamily N-acetyltransferase
MAADDTKSDAPREKVVIDLFQPADAAGVSECYRAIYGDAFPLSYVYDPDEIAARNAGNDQFTVVARIPSGKIIGLIGIFRGGEDAGVFEIGQLMVLKEYRDLDIGGDLFDFIVQNVVQSVGVKVLFGEALCHHTVSQKMALEQEMHPCGLELEIMPVSVSAGSDKKQLRKRDSLLLLFSLYQDRPQTVFLPSRYVAFCSRLYDRLGAKRTITAQGGTPAQKTASSQSRIAEARLLRITVTAVGQDLEQHLQEIMNSPDADQQDIVHVSFKLDDPAVEYGCTILEESGFFIGGLLPQWFGVDGLLFQKLPWIPDYSAVKLAAGEAEEMGRWVRSNMDRTQA